MTCTRISTQTVRLLIVLAIFGSFGCTSESKPKTPTEAKKKRPKSKPALVELATLARGKIEEILERSAPLEAEAQVQVLARTQNPAIDLLVEEGDRVTKGQVLLRLENDRQKTDYDQAKINLDQARVEFDEQQELFNDKLISNTEYRTAKVAFDQAQLQADNARRELEYTEVRAPIKGTISSRTVKLGDQVTNGMVLFEVVDLETTVAVINVPEQYLPKLRPGMPARLTSGTLGVDRSFDCSVKRISPIVAARAGTIKVVVEVQELGPLRPGMWVDVELVLSSKLDALLIPKPAIVYDNDQTFAFVVIEDEEGVLRAQRKKVMPQNSDKQHVEPSEGFEVGEQIVVAGHSGLKEGSAVRELETSDGSTPSQTSAKVVLKENSGASGAESSAKSTSSP
ncbi:MAG: efflux RND transporter periplasmic adaptor subunit [Planctomycetota bacterium]